MFNHLKNVLTAALAVVFLFSCKENTGNKSNNDSIPVIASVPEPPSNELSTALMHMKLNGKYDNVWDYTDGMIAVMKNEKYGFCDSTGTQIIPCMYDGPSNFREGVADVKKGGLTGFIDKTGKEIFPFRKYDYAGGFENGVSAFRVIKNGKELYGFVDKTGNEVVPPIYDELEVSWFGNGNAIVQKNGKWGTITKQNVVVIPFEYDKINDFNNGITTAKKGTKWGIIDTANKVLVPFTMTYKTVYEFSSGLAHVENEKDMEGYIDINGKEVLGGLKYGDAFGFGDDGSTLVSEPDGHRYILHKDGTTLFKDTPLEDIGILNENMFLITRNHMQGIVDKNDKVLLPLEYTSLMPMGKNLLLAVKNGIRFYADYKGNKVADYIEQ